MEEQLTTWVNSFAIGSPMTDNDTSVEIKEKFEAFKKWAQSKIEAI